MISDREPSTFRDFSSTAYCNIRQRVRISGHGWAGYPGAMGDGLKAAGLPPNRRLHLAK